MSDTFTITTGDVPALTEKCWHCEGRRYLLRARGHDTLPQVVWCDVCDRRGTLPSDFGQKVLRLVSEYGDGHDRCRDLSCRCNRETERA